MGIYHIVTVFYLLSIFFIHIFVFNTFSAFCSFNWTFYIILFFPFPSISIMHPFFSCCSPVCNINLLPIQIYFQITLYCFTSGITILRQQNTLNSSLLYLVSLQSFISFIHKHTHISLCTHIIKSTVAIIILNYNLIDQKKEKKNRGFFFEPNCLNLVAW